MKEELLDDIILLIKSQSLRPESSNKDGVSILNATISTSKMYHEYKVSVKKNDILFWSTYTLELKICSKPSSYISSRVIDQIVFNENREKVKNIWKIFESEKIRAEEEAKNKKMSEYSLDMKKGISKQTTRDDKLEKIIG